MSNGVPLKETGEQEHTGGGIKMKATREELLELIEQLPEEQIAEVAAQIKHLIELKNPLFKLKGLISSSIKDGSKKHDFYIFAEAKEETPRQQREREADELIALCDAAAEMWEGEFDAAQEIHQMCQERIKEEQEHLLQVKEKINKIQTDLVHSHGLTKEEIKLAIKSGLIDPEQAWWWREEWQKGEREAEKEIAQGKVSGPFENVDELIKHL